jgi:hypothetical protein
VDREAADVHAQNGLGMPLGLGALVGQLDASRLAAPADLHLRLDDDRIAEILGGLDGFGYRRGVSAVGHRNPAFPEQLLALVFEEIHAG